MADPIVISVTSEVSGALKGVQDVNAELQQTSKSLTDLGTGAAKSTDQLTEDFTQYTQQVKEQSTEQTAVVSDNIEEQGRIVKEGVKGTASAIAASVAQSASGMNGTFEGVAGSATNILSQLAYSIPEFGAIFAAGALAFGLIDGLLKQDTASAADLQAQISSLVGELIKAGTDGALPLADLTTNLKDLATQADPTKTSLIELDDAAKNSGNSATALADAYAGDSQGLKALDDTAKAKLATDQAALTLEGQNAHEVSLHTVALQDQTAAQQKVTDTLNSAVESQKKAAQVTEAYDADVKSLGSTSAEAAAKSAAAWTAAESGLSELGSNLASEQDKINTTLTDDQAKLATAVQDSEGKQTKAVVDARAAEVAASQKANVDTLAAFESELTTEVTDLLSTNANKVTIYEKFGKDAGAALIKDVGNNPTLLDALAGAGPTDIAKIKSSYALYGQAASESLTKEAQAGIDSHALTFKPVVVDADTSKASRALTALAQTKVNVIVTGTTRSGVKLF
jgi:hypothetical protein